MSGQASTPTVTKEDQNMIAEFSRRHEKAKELNLNIEFYKDALEKNGDLETELELADDDEQINVCFGSCFLVASTEETRELCKEKEEEYNKKLEDLKVKQKLVSEERDSLKKKLYAKFGNQIQLEEN